MIDDQAFELPEFFEFLRSRIRVALTTTTTNIPGPWRKSASRNTSLQKKEIFLNYCIALKKNEMLYI